MKQKGEITAFYIETLIMITVMMGILLVMTQILGLSKQGNIKAHRLTQAVTIAQSAAETASAAEDLEDFQQALGLEAFELVKESDDSQICSGIYHWDSDFRIRITRTSEDGLRTDRIQVFPVSGTEEIYSLVVEHAEDSLSP